MAETVPSPSPPRGDATREALVVAAIAAFGREGFHAVTTRAIAEEAGVNQALIGYHFGGKEGLYAAAFEHIAEHIRARLGPELARIDDVVGSGDAAACRAALERLTDAFAALMASAESASWARLVIREQQLPSAAFDVLYERVMADVLAGMTALVRRLDPERRAGDPELLVATLIGQVLVFRAAHAATLRLLGWRSIGKTELAAIQAQLCRNLAALLAPAGDAP